MTTVPTAGVLLPPMVFAAGLLAGLLRYGYVDVYTESLPLLAGLVAVGCFSSQLGVLMLAGFVLGDVVSTRPVLEFVGSSPGNIWFSGLLGQGLLAHLVHIRLPRLVTYLLLAAVVVALPRAARGAVAAFGRGRRVPAALAWLLVSSLVAVITWLGVSAWVAAAPTLVRPVFLWSGPSGLPTTAAVQPLQTDGGLVVAAGVVGSMLRQLWLGLAMFVAPVRERLAAAEASASAAVVPRGSRDRSPWPAAILTATMATLALAGILEHPALWVVAFAVFLAVRLLRSDQVRFPALDTWRRVTNVVPAWARLIGLWLLSRVVISSMQNDAIGSYSALAAVVLVSVVVVFLIFPEEPGRYGGRRSRPPEPQQTPPTQPAEPVSPDSAS